MKKLIYIVLGILLTPALALAQDGFKITAQTSGLPDGKMYLIYSKGGDTLATADMVNGNFVLTGKVDVPDVAYVMTADGRGRIPVMLENTEFHITANERLVLVEGELTSRNYEDKDGNHRKATEITVSSVHFCDSKKDGAGAGHQDTGGDFADYPDSSGDFTEVDDNGDLPF